MSAMLETIARPGMRMMHRLRLPVKFMLISAAFVVPLSVTLQAVASYANAGIDFAVGELQGTTYLKLMNSLLNRATIGNSELSALQQQTKQDADALKVSSAIESLAHSSNRQDLNDQLLKLYSSVGDNSGLILDPDLDSFYTMAVAVDYGPKLIIASNALSQRLANNSSDPAAAADARYWLSRLTDLQDSVTQAMQRIVQANPSLSARLDLTQWQLAQRELVSAANAALEGHSSAANQNGSVAIKASEQTHQLIDSDTKVLTELLQKRVAGFAAHRNWILLLTLGCLLLSSYLMVSFYLSDCRGFEALQTRMQKLASGDLTVNYPARGRDEIGVLINAFNSSREQLQSLVEGIHLAADSINTAGLQIAAANSDLAQRGSQQSSVISETAVRVKQIAEKVQANLEGTANANRSAEEAFNIAVRGKSEVDNVVQTMDAMTGSSKRIGAIINVINEIAFQTNLLALNAAVEAARAGEQGRGFAVVAGEVRNLAQRCASAANEITHLIKASVDDVGKGVTLVAKAGKSMDEILSSVRSVSSIMGEMAQASKTQADAIFVVDKAVDRIDGDAQQNAALVEQTSAAANMLSDQVRVLMESIRHFTLGSELESMPAAIDTPHTARAVPAPHQQAA
jgi:methyl-accepting chemotaxis protein